MKPRHLRIPTELIDSGRDILRKNLRRYFLSFRRGLTTREVCEHRGLAAIDENYQSQILRVKQYVERRGLSFPDFAEELQLLKDTKVEAEQKWNRIVADM